MLALPGDLEERAIRYIMEYAGRIVVVENVPALVCVQCSERLLRPEVAERVQRMVWGDVPPLGTIEADVYDFAEVV